MSATTDHGLENLAYNLEEEVKRISDAVKRLDDSRLTERVVVLLIQDAAGTRGGSDKKLSVKAIRRVLQAVRDLPSHCLKED
jgi:hypothetical protein